MTHARRRPRALRWGVVALIVLLLAVSLIGCGKKKEEQAAAAPPPPKPPTLAQIVSDMEEELSRREDMSADLSSALNFAVNSPAFHEFGGLNDDAVPRIAKLVEASEKDGLREMLLALAAETIEGKDLRSAGVRWKTGKEWARAWRERNGG